MRHLSIIGDLQALNRSGIAQVGKIFGWLVVVSHWTGCIWYLLAAFSWEFGADCDYEVDPLEGSLVHISGKCRQLSCEEFGRSWVRQAGLCAESSDSYLYLTSVYWAFSTLSTVGYGDISAESTWELAFSLVMMIGGVVFYSAIAGSVVGVINNFNAEQKEMNKKRENLNKFCKDHVLEKDLKKKLFDHLEFSFHNHEVGETMSYELDLLLEDLGPQLRAETMLFLHKDLIKSMAFFSDKSASFIVMVVTDLRPRIAYPEV